MENGKPETIADVFFVVSKNLNLTMNRYGELFAEKEARRRETVQ